MFEQRESKVTRVENHGGIEQAIGEGQTVGRGN
jgi:hypothetical protein